MAKKVFNIFTTILLIVLIVLVVMMFIMRASGNSLSVFGVRFYRVASYSMEPTLKKDDVIIVSKTPADEIKKGDIITYRAYEGELAGQPITHRVVEQPEQRSGTWFIRTQGDAEGAPLDPEITDGQLIGRYVMTIPLLGKFYSFFLTPYGLITIIVVILALFGYEMISLIVCYKAIDKIEDDFSDDPKSGEEKNKEKYNSKKEK